MRGDGANLPTADYAVISDCHSAALVSCGGSIDWLCFPRFDSPSVFGRLLDSSAGHWSIRPIGDARTTRRYVDATMLLERTFSTLQTGDRIERWQTARQEIRNAILEQGLERSRRRIHAGVRLG